MYLHICDFDSRALHVRTTQPAALASVSFDTFPEGPELEGYNGLLETESR